MTIENMTEAQSVSAKVKELYVNATPQNTRSLVESIATQTGKSKESVTQILVRAGLYVKPEQVKKAARTENGEVLTRDALAEKICHAIGFVGDSDSLAKANKAILMTILAKLES